MFIQRRIELFYKARGHVTSSYSHEKKVWLETTSTKWSTTFGLTNSMRQNPYWEADSRTTSQEIRLLQWNPFLHVSPSRPTLCILARYPDIYLTTVGVNHRSTGKLGIHLLSPVRKCYVSTWYSQPACGYTVLW